MSEEAERQITHYVGDPCKGGHVEPACANCHQWIENHGANLECPDQSGESYLNPEDA